MALTAAEHATVQAQTKADRNTAARVRRARLAARRAEAFLFEADADGEPTVFVVTAAEPGRAYVLHLDRETGQWRCSCFASRYSKSKTCSHETIANTPERSPC